MDLPAGDAQLVQIMDAALTDAALRAGEWLVCHAGCTPCCHGAFAVNALDAARLRAGMRELRLSDPSLAEAVEARARGWMAEHGPVFPGDAASGRLGDSSAEQEAFEEFANEAACPALDPQTGRCDVYAWRPMTCRVFGPPVAMEGGALGCCELCFKGATETQIAACAMTVPHSLEEQLLGQMDDVGETVVAFALVAGERTESAR